MTTKVFLVGYMGCGKSTLARKLSRRTGVRAVDTDAEVERMEGASVGDIFRYEGEERFRELERSVVERVAASGEACIVATGGGTVQCGKTAALLKERGKLIFLRATEATLLSRLKGCKDRPLLMGDLKKNLSALMERRLGQYERAADLAVDTDGLSAKAVAKKSLEAME